MATAHSLARVVKDRPLHDNRHQADHDDVRPRQDSSNRNDDGYKGCIHDRDCAVVLVRGKHGIVAAGVEAVEGVAQRPSWSW